MRLARSSLILHVLTWATLILKYISCDDRTHLYVIPTPDSNNKVIASIDDSFVLSCVSTGSNEDRPKALKWVTPTGKAIPTDSQQSRVYTVLQGDTLRLYFDKLAPSDSGTYTCEGVEAGGQKMVKADLVLQKRISFDGTVPNQLIKSGLDQNVICRASANPGPEIAWFRKGINVVIKNSNTFLYIKSLIS